MVNGNTDMILQPGCMACKWQDGNKKKGKDGTGKYQFCAHPSACQAVGVIFNEEALVSQLHNCIMETVPIFTWKLYRALMHCKVWHDKKKLGRTDYLPNFVLIITYSVDSAISRHEQKSRHRSESILITYIEPTYQNKFTRI
jgi:hypothetical protein